MASDAQPRYEALAAFVTRLVENGSLRPGMRAPSLRAVSRQHRTSLTTAIAAYRLLEDRGVLEARPQSGFFVAGTAASRLETPVVTGPPADATPVVLGSAVHELLRTAADPRLVPFGCAIPSTEVLASGRLDRFLARAARTRGADFNLYTAPRGDPALRAEIARRAMRWGAALAPEDIAVTCGCTEALHLALKVTTRPGDTVAIESPTYFGVLQVLEALGLHALELPTHAERGLDADALAQALNRHRIAACILSSSFSNPLGCTVEEADKQRILSLLAEHAVPLIEDDVYGDIHFGLDRPRPYLALAGQADVIHCGSFSKALAPGYRIGFVASARHLPAIVEHKLALTLSGPALPQAAVADYLASGGYDSHLRRLRRVFQDSLTRMRQAIERSFPPGTRASRPSGGFVLWVELPANHDARGLLARALAAGICFAPGDVFSPSGRYRNFLRLSCGQAWSGRLEAAVDTLGRLARAQTLESE